MSRLPDGAASKKFQSFDTSAAPSALCGCKRRLPAKSAMLSPEMLLITSFCLVGVTLSVTITDPGKARCKFVRLYSASGTSIVIVRFVTISSTGSSFWSTSISCVSCARFILTPPEVSPRSTSAASSGPLKKIVHAPMSYALSAI